MWIRWFLKCINLLWCLIKPEIIGVYGYNKLLANEFTFANRLYENLWEIRLSLSGIGKEEKGRGGETITTWGIVIFGSVE